MAHEHVTRAVIEQCRELEMIAVCRGTVVGVDVEAAREHEIMVISTPGRNADAVADFTIGCVLNLARHLTSSDRHHRTLGWQVDNAMPYLHFRGRELSTQTLGIVGFGTIGRKVAQRAMDGFGMEVLAYSRTPKNSPGVTFMPLAEVLKQSDFVALHCPLTEQTHNLISTTQLEDMKATAYLINMARGAVVDTTALIQALRDGQIAGAALDVYDPEPPHESDPLFEFDNLLLTPHVAGASIDVVNRHSEMAVDAILEATDPNDHP